MNFHYFSHHILFQSADDMQAKGLEAIQEVEKKQYEINKQWKLLKKEAAQLREKEKILAMVSYDYIVCLSTLACTKLMSLVFCACHDLIYSMLVYAGSCDVSQGEARTHAASVSCQPCRHSVSTAHHCWRQPHLLQLFSQLRSQPSSPHRSCFFHSSHLHISSLSLLHSAALLFNEALQQ